MIRPLSISHGANSDRTDRSRFRVEFDWTGTADASAYLSAVDAIGFGEELMPGGWAALRGRNHELALAGRDLSEEEWDRYLSDFGARREVCATSP